MDIIDIQAAVQKMRQELANPASATSATLSATYANKPTGLTDGQVPVWNAALSQFVPGDAGGGKVLRLIADRGRNSTSATTTTTTANQSKTDRTQHTVRADAASLQLTYGNVGANAVGANDITIAAAIEIEQVVYPVTFGGLARVTVAPGATVISDALPSNITVKAGQTIYVRTYVGVTAIGLKYPVVSGYTLRTTRQEATTSGTTGADLTVSGSTNTGFTQTNGGGIPPLGVLGVALTSTKSFGFFGDSITAGLGDDFWGSITTGGFLDRFAVANALPYVNYGLSGEKFSQLNTATVRNWRYGPESNTLTHGICAYGINDVTLFTLTQVKADAIAYWTAIKAKGIKLYQTTLTPSTTSTDAWATTANQTVKAFEAVRTGFNDWIRDGAPITSGVGAVTATFANNTVRAGDPSHPLKGFLEIADAAESARNSGIWKAGYTTDGIHPNNTANAAMALAINASKFV